MKFIFIFFIIILSFFNAVSQDSIKKIDITQAHHMAAREMWRLVYIDLWDLTKPKNQLFNGRTKELVKGGLDKCGFTYTITLVVNKNLTYIVTFDYLLSKNKCRVIASKISGGIDYDILDEEREISHVENEENKRLHIVHHSGDFSLITDNYVPTVFCIWFDKDEKYMYGFKETQFEYCK
jgi:hypothetical protein